MKYSIIIPIYNAEDYLDECLKSIIHQTLSFKDHFQIILINDGSTDSSESICLKYQEQYPTNFYYTKIKNSGPSKARNIGIEKISPDTDYVLFLDSDDKLNIRTFEEIEIFFQKYPDIKIGVLPVYYFEKYVGPIKLNNRFKNGSRIINIFEEYNSPQFYIGGTVFHKDLIVENAFNEDFKFWEDAIFVNELILQVGKYGLISGGKYWYRKRSTEDSLVDIAWKNKSRYIDLIENGYNYLLEYSKKLYGAYLPYVQFLIIYHLKLFLFQKNSKMLMNILSEKERLNFVDAVKSLLKKIDDQYILEQEMSIKYKEFLLYLKNDEKVKLNNDRKNINADTAITITKYKINGVFIELEGTFSDVNYTLKKEDKIVIRGLGRTFYTTPKNKNGTVTIWNFTLPEYTDSEFSIKVPIFLLNFEFGLISNNTYIPLRKINLLKNLIERFFKTIKKMDPL